MEGNFLEKPWYRRGWGKGIICVLFLVVVMTGGYVFTVLKYLRQIQSGEVITLEGPWSSKFTSTNVGKTNVLTDLSDLERSVYPKLGVSNAPIKIVMFSDYKCPNSKAAAPIMKRLAGKYGSKVSLIFRDFPLRTESTEFSVLARCAAKQNRFWKVHDLLFEYQTESETLTDEFLSAIINESGLDESSFRSCLEKPETEEEVTDDFFYGVGAGVRGTPTFFVNGVKVEGAIPFDVWAKYIESI